MIHAAHLQIMSESYGFEASYQSRTGRQINDVCVFSYDSHEFKLVTKASAILPHL